MLTAAIASVLQEKCQVDPSLPLVVGVSGGPDSLCLLDVLWRLGCRLVVAHLDHGLRPESQADAAAVRREAEARRLPFVLRRAAVEQFAEAEGLSIEEAARSLRYRFLFEQAQEHGAQAVAVAHTADDQVETLLMHLLRGAGLAGLRGMAYRSLPNAWSSVIPLVRPLLGVRREAVLAYLTRQGIQPLIDLSNQDTRFFRNRLRHELIPYLEQYNPRLKETLLRTADVLRQDYAALEAAAGQAWQRCFQAAGNGFVALDAAALRQEPASLQRMLLRRAIAALRPGLRDIDFQALERALAFVSAPSRSGQTDLSAGLRLLLEGRRLWVAGWEAALPGLDWPQLPACQAHTLVLPGSVRLDNGWELRFEPAPGADQARREAARNTDPYQAWVDVDTLPASLDVRPRRPGDRILPLGMGGHSAKLSDVMVNWKLPRRLRQRWPLVAAGEQVVWLPGYRLAEPYRLTEATRQAARLRLLPTGSSKQEEK